MGRAPRNLKLFDEERDQTRSQIARDILARVKHWTQDDPPMAKRRWVWELFQNAIDVAAERGNNFDIRINLNKQKQTLIFAHNAGPFQRKHLVALILGGSWGKPWGPDSKMLGRFGSGFLVSHVLSRAVQISGKLLDDGKQLPFSIEIDRRGGTEDEIRADIDKCYNQVNQAPDRPCSWEAEFSYVLEDTLGHQAAEQGLEDLVKLLPFFFTFTDLLHTVKVGDLTYERVPTTQSVKMPAGIQLVETRVIRRRKMHTVGTTLKVTGDDVQIAFPVASHGGDTLTLARINQDVPRIFVAVPFIGTESLGLPFVINSDCFAPNESRDSIPLAIESGDRTESDKNRRLVDAAMQLYLDAIRSLASGKTLGLVEAVRFTQPEHPKQAVKEYFRVKVSEALLALFNQVKCVGTTDQGNFAPDQCSFPVPLVKLDSNQRTGIDDFDERVFGDYYNLFGNLILDRPLPLREEAYSWQAVIWSWARINPDICPDWICLDKLRARLLACGKTDSNGGAFSPTLEDLAQNTILGDAREFMSALFGFLDELYNLPTKPIEAAYANSLLLNQRGCLSSTSFHIGKTQANLWSDEGIPTEIKDLSNRLCPHGLRMVLLDSDFKRFGIVSALVLPQMTVDSAVDFILQHKPQDGYTFPKLENDKAEAWVDLCVFLALNEKNGLTKKLPLLVKSGEAKYLIDERLLPPFPAIGVNPEYEDIFPEDRILSDRYSTSAGEKRDSFWQALASAGVVHSQLIFATDGLTINGSNVHKLRTICKGEIIDGEHTVAGVFWCFPFWQEVRGRIGQHLNRSRAFLNLLLDVVCPASTSWQVAQARTCTCNKDHQVFPADWLMQVKTSAWVAVSRDTEKHIVEAMGANEANIVELVGKEQIRLMLGKQFAVDLLSHLGFSKLTLSVEAYVDRTPGAREEEVAETLSTVLRSEDSYDLVKGVSSLSPDDLSKVKEVVVGLDARRKRAAINKAKGEKIELCVRSLLRDKYHLPVNPQRVTAGADIEIEIWPEDVGFDACSVEIGNTLVEVKLVTGGNRVRMSSRQGQEAQSHKGKYYLCVVDFRDNDASQLLVMAESQLQEIVNRKAFFSDMLGRFDGYFAEGVVTDDIEADINGFWVRNTLWGHGVSLESWVDTINDMINSESSKKN